MSNKEAFYEKLKESLEETTSFPANYLYKFIVPTSGKQKEEVVQVFSDKPAKINTKSSKTGKYVSVSIELTITSSHEVITYYRKVEKIEGIISL